MNEFITENGAAFFGLIAMLLLGFVLGFILEHSRKTGQNERILNLAYHISAEANTLRPIPTGIATRTESIIRILSRSKEDPYIQSGRKKYIEINEEDEE